MADDRSVDSLRIPPHSQEAEQSVLGALLLDNTAADRIGDLLSEADFYGEAHRLIYRAISDLIVNGKPADVVTVAEALDSVKRLDYVGGLAYLGALVQVVPTAANVRRYAEIVRERSILRGLAAVATEIADTAFNAQGRPASQVLDEAESKVFHIAEQGARGQQVFQPIQPLLTQVVERIEELYSRDNPSDVTGVPTGFTDLDRMTSGLQPGDLVIIAGRPSMGKTAFALNIGEHIALHAKKAVGVFSMEMGATQLAMRMIGSVGRLDQHKLRTGRLGNEDWERLSSALGRLSEARLFIDETPALNPLELRSRARRLHRQAGGYELGAIVVDYLQLMQGASQGENRATEISEISRSLKALAKELHVPVLALSQLNRSLEQRPNKRPVMSDLRECVVGDTLVCLADGRRVPIRDLVGAQPEVLSMSPDRRIVPGLADKVWSVGVRPVFDVHLASGRSIRATAMHRLFGCRGWRRVEELRAGDRLAMARCGVSPRATAAVRGTSYGGSSQFRFAPSRSTLVSSANLLDDDGLRAAAGDDLFWDRVVALEPAGHEEVFDLTVPRNASWLADGIVSHNSGAIEQDADVILFIYRDEVYNPDTQDKGIAEIIIGKQRNGPIGAVRLTFLGEFTRFENYAHPGSY